MAKKLLTVGELQGSERRQFKPLNRSQQQYAKAIETSTLTLVAAPAGVGKTFIGVSVAVQLLLSGRIKKIILSRPTISCDREELGFLPGLIADKYGPFITPIYDVASEYLDKKEIKSLEEAGVIELLPIAFVRGRTFKDCVVLVDEAQNLTRNQIVALLTRIGDNCRIVLMGDPTQSDLFQGKTDFEEVIGRLDGMEEVSIIKMSAEHIVRHPLISKIIARLS